MDIKLNNIQLQTGQHVYARFQASKYTCPLCQEVALEDNWPPNRGGGSGVADGDAIIWESDGTVKCVCSHCRIAFRMYWYRKQRDLEILEEITRAENIVPLVEQGGVWLTPYDVWRETYKSEHGDYPREVYA